MPPKCREQRRFGYDAKFMREGRNRDRYVPALRFDWLTPLYDPLLRRALRESTFKRTLVEQARCEKCYRVLDLGCGTATLTLLIKKTYPEAGVVGLDGDPDILRIAGAKALDAHLDVGLVQSLANNLPFPENWFDRVVSSLLFHHLTRENKVRALREALRVLRPAGELHIADWGRPGNALLRGAFLLVQLLDGFETTADNVHGLLPGLCNAAGFEGVQELGHHHTSFGTIRFIGARKPMPKKRMNP